MEIDSSCTILGRIEAEHVSIGKNVFIGENTIIQGMAGRAQSIVIGDNVKIFENCKFLSDDLTVLDYTKIHNSSFIYGKSPIRIGCNCWFGSNVILDTLGGVIIGHNCGVGSHSQIWSHIRYGDMLIGCRFHSYYKVEIGNDVWCVGHCLVSPIIAKDMSMALIGSNVVKNMEFNTIYAGNPARDVTEKMGRPFRYISVDERIAKMLQHKKEYFELNHKYDVDEIHISDVDGQNPDISWFNVVKRTYNKRQTETEVAFMDFLLPTKAKFIPKEYESTLTVYNEEHFMQLEMTP